MSHVVGWDIPECLRGHTFYQDLNQGQSNARQVSYILGYISDSKVHVFFYFWGGVTSNNAQILLLGLNSGNTSIGV